MADADRRVVWSPQPRQAAFMARWEDEALYGGAAGGGKSDALIVEALRQVNIPYYRALIVRRTYPQLEDLIGKSQRYYPAVFPAAKYNGSDHQWRFPSGATIQFRSMPHEDSKYNFQGLPWDFIGVDECTHLTYTQYTYLTSRNRPNGPGTRVYMRCTANPGGVGHSWVKTRWITAAPPMQTTWQRLPVVYPDGSTRYVYRSSIFVPARVFDNQILLHNDPGYLATLAALPESERQALLYGDWDSFSGQVFSEWRDDPAHYADRVWTHVVDPFVIPDDWSIYCGMDWGYSHPFSVGWYAVDHTGMIYRIREYYGCTGVPNTGVKLDPTTVAQTILQIEQEDVNLRGRQITRIGDPAIWGSDGTTSIGAMFEREMVYFLPGDHARIDGKMQVHYRLRFDAHGKPKMQIFKTCPSAIRTLPALVYSQTQPEDVDTDCEDHIYDELRYVCMANPIAAPQATVVPPAEYDPLDLANRQRGYDRYAWYRQF